MATTKATAKPTKAAATAFKPAAKVVNEAHNLPFVFGKENYQIMIAGVVVIILGFLLMLGVANDNPAVFPADEIYSFRRITLAPIVVVIGFAIEVYAILKRPTIA